MEPIRGDVSDFEITSEIDALRWVPVEEAARFLSYRHDRELLWNSLTRDGGNPAGFEIPEGP